MRVVFNLQEANSRGRELSTVLRKVGRLPEAEFLTHSSMKQVEASFHNATTEEQYSGLTNPFWDLIRDCSHTVQAALTKNTITKDLSLDNGKRPIVFAFKDGVGAIAEVTINGNNLDFHAINIDKGGLASNTAEALVKLGSEVSYGSIHGRGEIATLHEALLLSVGINPVKLIDSGRDAYIHPGILFLDDKSEYWFVQKRLPVTAEILDRFTECLKEASRTNYGEALVLSSLPQNETDSDYFAELSKVGASNDNVIFYNPKQYDKIRGSSTSLFKNGIVDFLKPNMIEFVQFLRFAGLIQDSDFAEKSKISDLKHQIKLGQDSKTVKHFNETVQLARKLMDEYNLNIRIMLISFSENGSLIITPRNAAYVSAPNINLQCSSGAGDSGLAHVIVVAKKNKINLHNEPNDVDITQLAEAFNYAASATASLPGDQIADLRLIKDLRASQKLIVLNLD